MAMQTTNLKQARRTSIYPSRAVKHNRPTVTPGTVLPPRDLFAGRDELLTAYDEFVALSAAIRTHNADEHRLRTEASEAQQQYHRDVRDAMAKGKDASSVTNHADELEALADQHADYSTQAKRGADAIGYTLGVLIAEAAPELYAPAEAQMAKNAEQVAKAVERLRVVWSEWAAAYQARLILSNAATLGGSLSAYRDSVPLPADVAAALNTLEDHIKQLDRLKEDEQIISDWRAQEARAIAAPLQ